MSLPTCRLGYGKEELRVRDPVIETKISRGKLSDALRGLSFQYLLQKKLLHKNPLSPLWCVPGLSVGWMVGWSAGWSVGLS